MLQVLQVDLNSNTMSVPSIMSTGFGYGVISVLEVYYVLLDNTVFTPPGKPNQGHGRVRIAAAEVIMEANMLHMVQCEDFILYWAMERKVKALLVAAVPHIFQRTVQ